MGGDDKDEYYCSICGGIPRTRSSRNGCLSTAKRRESTTLTGFFEEVAKLRPPDDAALTEELMKRVREFNYVPTKKRDGYAAAILAEYKKQRI